MVKINFEDDFATTMVEELLIHGYLEMSCLILKILAKHFKARVKSLEIVNLTSIYRFEINCAGCSVPHVSVLGV